MNIGDYIRTKSYGIKKANGFSSSLTEDFIDCNYDETTKVLINRKEVIKSSPNIIDLIEVGDILMIKDMFGNVSKVEVDEDFKLLSGTIVSIVTKEQFESMEYKVGE